MLPISKYNEKATKHGCIDWRVIVCANCQQFVVPSFLHTKKADVALRRTAFYFGITEKYGMACSATCMLVSASPKLDVIRHLQQRTGYII